MKKKVKKFGRGGDILAGVGLGLIGKAVYDKIKGDKDSDLKAVEPRGGGAMTEQQKIARQRGENAWADKEEKSAAKSEPKEETREEYLEKRGAKPLKETGTRENTLYKEDEPKKVVTTTPKKAAPTAKKVAPKPEAKVELPKPGESKVVGEGSLKPYPKDVKKPEAPVTEDVKKPETKKYGIGPYGAFSGIHKAISEYKTPAEVRREERLKREKKDVASTDMKRGGKVKKYNGGGTTSSKPEPKKDTMPEWAKTERENRRRDELNKREAEGAAKEVKRNMSTFGFKKGGSASSRADGIAIRGKTRA
jgi:hypothetical protein